VSPAVVHPLSGVEELRAASDDDAYVRAMADPVRTTVAWRHEGGAVGWLMRSRHAPGRSALMAIGAAAPAADLLHRVATEDDGGIRAATLPRGAVEHLPAGWSLEPANEWEWFHTEEAPPVQQAEALVRRLDDGADAEGPEILALLETWSPRHDAEPGQDHVRLWCGIRDDDGQLVAVAAHTEYSPGVPFLASIATVGSVRGRGYGAAVTAWITRELLATGSDWVTLGMYSDNEVARRLYHRLGFRCDHYFTSGPLVRPV
jgi:ribosomal protein S18 acetylase RimI-like enzyme